jgi:putative aldouronate transport system permease protein
MQKEVSETMKTANILTKGKFRQNIPLHLMLLPGIALVLVFNYAPMFGIVMAFQDFNPGKGFLGSKFTGFENFKYLLAMPDIYQVLFNTVFIAFLKILTGLVVPIIIALLINEVQKNFVKRSIQTAIYLPYFLSWVILGGILIDILSPSEGIVNIIIKALGFEPVFFLGDAKLFPYVLTVTNIWKEFGFGTIIYLASITSISPSLYEAAIIDGASRWKQTLHITLPGMAPIIVLMATMSLGNVLNAGFDQVFNLYSPITYKTGDILDTFVYRLGLVDLQFSVSAAVGFFKSAVSCALIVFSYRLAYKYANYRIF